MNDRPLSFGSAATFQQRVTLLPDTRMRWLYQSVIPESGSDRTPVTLYYRDPVDAVQSLLDRPSLAEHLDFTPRRAWRNKDRKNRVYDEIMTGNWAWEVQVRVYSHVNLEPL